MLEMTLFTSSVRDEEGNPLVKALLSGSWDPEDGKRVSEWLSDTEKHVLTVADGNELVVRWLG